MARCQFQNLVRKIDVTVAQVVVPFRARRGRHVQLAAFRAFAVAAPVVFTDVDALRHIPLAPFFDDLLMEFRVADAHLYGIRHSCVFRSALSVDEREVFRMGFAVFLPPVCESVSVTQRQPGAHAHPEMPHSDLFELCVIFLFREVHLLRQIAVVAAIGDDELSGHVIWIAVVWEKFMPYPALCQPSRRPVPRSLLQLEHFHLWIGNSAVAGFDPADLELFFKKIVNGKRGSVSRSSVNVNPVPGDLPAGFFRLEPGIGRRIAERKCELSVRFALNRDFHAGDEFQMLLQFACGELF